MSSDQVSQVNWINKKLAENYGKDDLGRPNFRISWSDDQREKRKCRPRIYLGDIFVRQLENEEVQEVPKYPFLHARFVLERLQYHCNEELVENPSYEPIHVFQDKAGNALPVVWDMVDYACHYIMTGQVKSKQAYEEEKARQDHELVENTRAELKNDRPYLPTMIEMGEAASIKKVDYWERYRNESGTECGSNDCNSSAISDQVGETNS